MSEALHISNSLDTPIQYIKGVGPKRANVLESLNIFTIKDLLYYFPRKYVDRTSLSTIGSIKEGEEVNLVGRVKSTSLKKMKKGNFVTSTVADHTGSVRLMWFNAADYIHQSLKVGDLLTMHGKVAAYKGNHQIVSIKIDDDTQKGNKKILEDYLVAACNDAMNKLEKETKDKMGSVMNLPGGMKLPF